MAPTHPPQLWGEKNTIQLEIKYRESICKQELPYCAYRAYTPAMCDQRPIWTSGEHGYNTYRIPSLLTTSSGTVLAFCEGRVSDPGTRGQFTRW